MKALKCRECGREYPLTANARLRIRLRPARSRLRLRPHQKVADQGGHRSRARKRCGVTANCCPSPSDPTVGIASRFHAAGQGRPARQEARHPRTLGQERRGELPHAVVQGPRRERGVEPRAANWASTPSPAPRPAIWPMRLPPKPRAAGLKSYVFIPSDLEHGKIVNSLIYGANVIGIKGHYDEVNRLCAEIAGKFGWAFVNVNMRPYYAEGSKSMAYEIAEQLGWRAAAAHRRPDGVRLVAHENPEGLSGTGEARPRRRQRRRPFTARRRRAVRRFPSRKRRAWISSSRSSPTRLRNRSPSARRRTVFTRSR